MAPSSPLGTSTATLGRRRAASASITARATPSIGRARPAPKIASIDDARRRRAAPASAARPRPATARRDARHRRVSRSRAPSSPSRTGQPARARCRAATNPSPPLLPGPHSTATGRGDQRRIARFGDGAPRRLHQRDAGNAAGNRGAVGAPPSRRASAARSSSASHCAFTILRAPARDSKRALDAYAGATRVGAAPRWRV